MKAKLFIASVAIAFSSPSFSENIGDLVNRAQYASSKLCTVLGDVASISLEKISVNPQGVYEILMSDGPSNVVWYDKAHYAMVSDLKSTTMQPAEFGLYWKAECMKNASNWIDSMVSR